jgi:hypothetical protein
MTSNKHQIMNNDQMANIELGLSFRIWNLFDVWDLGFGNFNL